MSSLSIPMGFGRAGGGVEYIGGDFGNASSGSINLDATLAESGDLLIVFLTTRNATISTLGIEWTVIINEDVLSSEWVVVAYRYMTPTDPTDYTFTASNAGGTSGFIGSLLTVRGSSGVVPSLVVYPSNDTPSAFVDSGGMAIGLWSCAFQPGGSYFDSPIGMNTATLENNGAGDTKQLTSFENVSNGGIYPSKTPSSNINQFNLSILLSISP